VPFAYASGHLPCKVETYTSPIFLVRNIGYVTCPGTYLRADLPGPNQGPTRPIYRKYRQRPFHEEIENGVGVGANQ
jgi:hypothetical protein